jgi:hypothetical protein
MGHIPMFSIILGITKTIRTMKPTIKPIGLFRSDIMLNGSLTWAKQIQIHKSVQKEFDNSKH